MEHLNDTQVDGLALRSRLRSRPSDEAAPGMGLGNEATAHMLAGGVDRAGGRSQGAGPLDPEIATEIRSEQGGGRPLDDDTRADMEGHLDTDLTSVRVHDGARADALSRSVQAEAFTTGTDVFFQSGKYQPTSNDGRRLLAHELTHVVQQSSGQTGGAGTVSHPDDKHEIEARAVGDTVATAPAVGRQEEEEVQPSPDPTLSRQEEEEEEVMASPDPTLSRQEEEEEEELMASPDPTLSRQEEEEEELMASPDPTLSRQEEEEELMASPDPTLSRQEEEEVMASPDPTLSRQEEEEEEEELMASPDPTLSRQEEEEELMASPDPTLSRQEEAASDEV